MSTSCDLALERVLKWRLRIPICKYDDVEERIRKPLTKRKW